MIAVVLVLGLTSNTGTSGCIEQSVQQAYTNAELVIDCIVLRDEECIGINREEAQQRVEANLKAGKNAYHEFTRDPEGWDQKMHDLTLKVIRAYKGDLDCDTIHLLCEKSRARVVPKDNSSSRDVVEFTSTSTDWSPPRVGTRSILYCTSSSRTLYAHKDSVDVFVQQFGSRHKYWTSGLCMYPTVPLGLRHDSLLQSIATFPVSPSPCESK